MKKIVKPDVTNEDPQYWERVLESHGLGKNKHKLTGGQQGEIVDNGEDYTFISIEEAQKLGLMDKDE